MGRLKRMFPAPGSSIGPAQVIESRKLYGDDVVYVMGRGLYERGTDLVENARSAREMLEK